MSELLFRISHAGLINQQYICHECQANKQAQSIHSILDKTTFIKLTKAMNQDEQELLINEVLIDDTNHFLYIHQIGNQYLLYANEMMNTVCKNAIIHLVGVFADQYMIPDHDNKEETKFLFDSIQKLNNTLVNKQRETAKLNQELNRLNKILNNRLVKDPLTKLVSRYQYRDEILLHINKHPESYGLFWFIDIDDFKQVNDTYGHQIGDQYLIEVANRLNSLPFEDTVKMRIAGDEFGLYMSNIPFVEKEQIDSYYDIFSKTLLKPIEIDQYHIPFACSIGIAIYNKDTTELHVLIDYADYAMYQAKQQGKNQYRLFNKDEYIR